MVYRYSFDSNFIKESAAEDTVKLVQNKTLPLNVAVTTQSDLFSAQTLEALNTEVNLSDSLLKYDVVYKPPTKAVFEVPEATPEADISHIDHLSSVLSQVKVSLELLQGDVGTETETGSNSLQAKTREFLQKYQNDPDVQAILGDEFDQADNKRPIKSFQTIFTLRKNRPTDLADDASKLFDKGQLLLKETQTIGSVHNKLLLLQRAVLKRLLALREDKKRLAEQITDARQRLDVSNRSRLEDLGDYALAQRLVSDDWQQVEQRFKRRREILEAYTGLYYVRVRETAAGQLLPDALSLRSQSAGDVVPGCTESDTELPDDLLPFMDTVLDIPLSDWRLFENDAHLLPGRTRQVQLFDSRQQRLFSKANRNAPTNSQQSLRLMPLLQVNTQILSVFAGKTLQQSDSLQQQLKNAHSVLSLEDVLNGSRGLLSGRAQTLQKQLTQASACFLNILRQIQPSIRFRWAQLVEDRKLAVEQPERWPNLADVQKSDFNRVRTLVELVVWCYRQLSDQASDNSRTAITHLLSACILIAASDDPEQILHGSVQTLPGVFRPGEFLRLKLNRDALPGTQLQLLDAQRQVVGLLRVDDQDSNGTVATVMQMYQSVSVREGLSVSGKAVKRLRAGQL